MNKRWFFGGLFAGAIIAILTNMRAACACCGCLSLILFVPTLVIVYSYPLQSAIAAAVALIVVGIATRKPPTKGNTCPPR